MNTDTDSQGGAILFRAFEAQQKLGLSDAQIDRNLAAGKNAIGHDYCCECEACIAYYGPGPTTDEIRRFEENMPVLTPEEEAALEKARKEFILWLRKTRRTSS